MSRECRYTHDVSAERFEDVSGEQWACPRQAAHDGRCAFHASPDAVSDATVRAAFLDAVSGEGGALWLIGTHLGSLSLEYAVLEGPSNHPIDLREAEIDGDLSTTADDIVVDCSETATVSGEITSSDGDAKYLFAGATVGELDVADDTTFDVFTFDETTFSGFDFGTYNRALAARNWRLHEPDVEREPERLENLSLRAKNGANYIGETRASAEFFTREMVYRRAGHRRRIVSGDDLRTRIGGVTGWLSNAALQVSCGYGERPFRPVTVSAGLVVVFAGVYGWLDAPINYAEPVGYLTFSLEVFVSVLLGLPNTGRSVLALTVALEGFLGGFLIACSCSPSSARSAADTAAPTPDRAAETPGHVPMWWCFLGGAPQPDDE